MSQRRKEPFDLMLVRYGIERRLYRLSRSSQAEKFLLKGAMLFAIWSDGTHRPTRDVDLLGSGPHDDETLKAIFTELCRLETEPDGRAATHPAQLGAFHARAPFRDRLFFDRLFFDQTVIFVNEPRV